ncbi:MAG: hypothetical protein Q9196_001246 [Gyalolechia fulgens]
MARSLLFVISCIAMNPATIFAHPADPPPPEILAPAAPNLLLNGTVPNFEVKCDGVRFGRNLNPASCAEVQSRIPNLGGNLVNTVEMDQLGGRYEAAESLGPADGLCVVEVAETQEARGSYLDLATVADEMNQICVDYSLVPEGSIGSNIGKASQLGMRYGEEQDAELLVGLDGKLILTMRSYQPNVQCRKPIIISDQASSDEILRRMPAMAGQTVFGRQGLPGVRVILPVTFTSSE